MASKQSKFKRSFPFLLALVVLISCLPVVPVFAANSMTLEGVWEIGDGWEQAYSDGYHSFFNISVDAYVFIDGEKQTVSSIFIDEREPDYVGISNSLWSERGFHDSGNHVVDDGRIYFNKVVTITDRGAIDFFTYYATQDTSQTYKLIVDDHEVHSHFSPWFSQSIVDSEGTTFECTQCSWTYVFTYSGEGVFNGFVDASGKKYFDQCIFNVSTAELRLTSTTTSSGGGSGSTQSFTSIITIDGQEFTFTSTTEQPAVLLEVLSDGAVMSYGNQTLYYVYPGDIFLGLGASSTGAAVFVPGGTYPLAAGDHVLYSVSGHVIDPDHPPMTDPFTATIVIDGRSFEFSGGDSYPVVRLGVGSSKVAFGLGDTVVNYWYPTPLGGQTFLGFSTSSDCLVVDYPVNEVNSPALSDPIIEFCDISFSQSNSVLTLYPVYSYSPSGGSGGSGSGSVDDPAGVGTILSRFAQFLVSPLMVFFNAEFIPGFSFGKLALVAFCFGLVFWLLRVSS